MNVQGRRKLALVLFVSEDKGRNANFLAATLSRNSIRMSLAFRHCSRNYKTFLHSKASLEEE